MIDYANQSPRRRSRGFRNFLVSSALITAVWGLSIYGSQTELGQDFRKYFIEAGVKDCEIIHKRPGKGDNNTEFVERVDFFAGARR